MQRVCENMKQTQEPISLISIRVRPNAHFDIPEAKIDAAIGQIGTMLKSLVRMQEITARVDRDMFMIAFPGQDLSAIMPVMKRLEGIVDSAAFDSGDTDKGAFTMLLETAAVDYMYHDTSDAFISAALSELTGEPIHIDKKSA